MTFTRSKIYKSVSDIDTSLNETLNHRSQSQICSENDILLLSDSRLPFLALPNEIIGRVLYYTHLQYGVSNLINFLYSCRELYYRFIPVLYRLSDVVLKGDSGPGWMKHPKGLNTLLFIQKNWRVADSILCLSVSMERSLKNKSKFTKFENQLLITLPKMERLTSLVLYVNYCGMLKVLSVLPKSLKSLCLKIKYSHKMFIFFKRSLFTSENFVKNWDLPNLKYLKLLSTDPILQSHIHSYLYPLRGIADEFYYGRYFTDASVAQFETLNAQWKRNWIIFGKILYNLIDSARTSLHSIELGKIDLGLVLNSEHIKNINYHFPNLRLLLIDNISKMRLSSWMNDLQIQNMELRNEKPLFIVINDTLGGGLYTKSARARKLNPDESEYRLWSFLDDPKYQLKRIKLNLKLET